MVFWLLILKTVCHRLDLREFCTAVGLFAALTVIEEILARRPDLTILLAWKAAAKWSRTASHVRYWIPFGSRDGSELDFCVYSAEI